MIDMNSKNQSCYVLLTSVYSPAAAVTVTNTGNTIGNTIGDELAAVTALPSEETLSGVSLPALDTFSTLSSDNTAEPNSKHLETPLGTDTDLTVVGASTPPVLFTNYYCNYANLNSSVFDINKAKMNLFVLQSLCNKLSSFGCCAGSMIQYLQQNQVSVLQGGSPLIVPPCVLNYLTQHCSTMTSLDTLCNAQSVASQTTIMANVTLTKTSSNLKQFPNIYNEASVLNFQGTVSAVLTGFGFNIEPYHFLSTYPFQVMLSGYVYYNHTQPLVKSHSGGMMYYPPGGDYTAATSGRFTYQLTVQNLNSTYIQQLTAVLQSSKYASVLGNAFASPQPPVTKTSTLPAKYSKIEPKDVTKNSASSISSSGSYSSVVMVLGGIVMMFMML